MRSEAATLRATSGRCDFQSDLITAVATSEDGKIIVEAVRPLCEPVHGCGNRAWDVADLHFGEHGMSDQEYVGGRAHLTRYHMRRELASWGNLPGEWQLCPPRPNGEIVLSLGALKLRFLRPGPVPSDMLPPPPGHNRARIDYYRNPKINLYGGLGSTLICVWAVDEETKQLKFRIVRTTAPWRVGQKANIDVDFELPSAADQMAGMEFEPKDPGFDFPFFDEEAGEEDADGIDG